MNNIDLTKYCVCRNCGNINLIENMVDIPPQLLSFKFPCTNSVVFNENRYCYGCIRTPASLIVMQINNCNDSFLDELEKFIHQFPTVLTKEITEYFKSFGLPYKTIEEYFVKKKVHEKQMRDSLQKFVEANKQTKKDKKPWWLNMWNKICR